MLEMNDVLEKLPKHLLSLVIDQPYNEYTPQDHAVWRYIMRQNVRFLSQVAYGDYIENITRTGISLEEIPHMYGMNRILQKIGWAAVSVDGFIPPAAFMEFQKYNVLVIAADMRPIDQIQYTPAPDIVHEAAGHAPIIAHQEYAEYLELIGTIGAWAFPSNRDNEQFEAIRHLSIIKADPYSKPDEIEKAERHLAHIEATMGARSEVALIRNLFWWTAEYGLIGDVNAPKIYGAGLLSSIGESYNCLQDTVRKIPYSIEAKDIGFDITKEQPQLFVASSFQQLKDVALDFAQTMAFKVGGSLGVDRAIASRRAATLVLSSGIQLVGTFTERGDDDGDVTFVRSAGQAMLAVNNKMMKACGPEDLNTGLICPLGHWEDVDARPEFITDSKLNFLGIITERRVEITYASGFKVAGTVRRILRHEEKLVLITLTDAEVSFMGEHSHFSLLHLPIGTEVISAFHGPVDPNNFGLTYSAPEEKTHKITHTEENKKLHSLYQKVRDRRVAQTNKEDLTVLWNNVKNGYPSEWLLPLEILEIAVKEKSDMLLKEEIESHLQKLSDDNESLTKLIRDGFALIR